MVEDLEAFQQELVVLLRSLKELSLVYLEMIIQSSVKFQKHLFSVTVRWMVVTMLILKLSAKLSTSVPEMAKEDYPGSVSFVPTALCSISSTSSVTGGSM